MEARTLVVPIDETPRKDRGTGKGKLTFGLPERATRRGRRSFFISRDAAVKPRRLNSANRNLRYIRKPTLRQTCSWENPRAPFAFKDSMIH